MSKTHRIKAKKGIVLATVTEGDLQRPDFFRMIGCHVYLGRPRKGQATLDYAVINDLPKERTSFDVLNRMQEIGVQVISWHPIPGAIPLLTLKKALKQSLKAAAILISSEEEEEKQALIQLGPKLMIFSLNTKNIEEAARWLDWSKEQAIPLIIKTHPESLSLFHGAQGIWIEGALSLEECRIMSLSCQEQNAGIAG